MRIEELQVGDWYQWDDYPYQRTKEMFASDDATISCIEPIPLTEDIVSHNIPFVRCWDISKELPLGTVAEYREETETAFIEVYYYHDRESKFVVEIRSRSNNDRICLHVNYVHELQRALRCFRLFDLADNFKI